MSYYLTKAERYQDTAEELFGLLPEDQRDRGVELIARLVNAGVVSVPRACQSTVRLNIVNKVCENLPIKCSLKETFTDEGKSYKALVVSLLYPGD